MLYRFQIKKMNPLLKCGGFHHVVKMFRCPPIAAKFSTCSSGSLLQIRSSQLNVTLVRRCAHVSPSVENSAIKRHIGKWLLGCSGMVFGAVVLGGVTRLTESGLSMVDWHMFKEVPPMTTAKWEEEFAKYKEFPEFKYKHTDITMQDFKWIWYMEYIHRMWGRATGAVFLLPATYFWYKGWFKTAMKVRVSVYGALLGIQGLLGWYMVKSGLEHKKESPYVPRVSQNRLALHLGMAFFLYSLFLWSSFTHLMPPQPFNYTTHMRKLWLFSHGSKGLIFLTVISGAFVAGLGAGLTYNTFPKMADKWIPDDILAMEPTRKNFTSNPTTVQFVHRVLGTTTVAYIAGLWWYSRKFPLPPRARLLTHAIAGVAVLQITLGICTLLYYVPVPLAAMHQAGALTLLSFALWLGHELKMIKRLPKV